MNEKVLGAWWQTMRETVRQRGYLAGGEQKALRYLVGLIREELVQLPSDLHRSLAQPQQWYVDAMAKDVLYHHLRLPGDGAAEQLTQMILL